MWDSELHGTVTIGLAQLALGRYGHLELRSNGGIEAGAGCRGVLESGAMEPAQVVVEVFGGHAAPGAQEGLDPLMQAVDGLDVQVAAHPWRDDIALAGRWVRDGLIWRYEEARRTA